MDLYKIIRELHEERERLNGMIRRLESLRIRDTPLGEPLRPRRGRKEFSNAGRPEAARRVGEERHRRRKE
jgi:hypothetical protein